MGENAERNFGINEQKGERQVSPKEMSEASVSRVISDGDLKEAGAKYIKDPLKDFRPMGENPGYTPRLEVTNEQRTEILAEMLADCPELMGVGNIDLDSEQDVAAYREAFKIVAQKAEALPDTDEKKMPILKAVHAASEALETELGKDIELKRSA